MGKALRRSIVWMIVPLLPLIDLAAMVFPLRHKKTK